ncbi:MAG: ammonia-forming cytochrome c nitrite reductase subunit c552, partial [Pirellulaceae bacterium]
LITLALIAVSIPFAMSGMKDRGQPVVKPDPRVLPRDAVNPHVDYSNILPGDYVGPESCAECHSEYYDRWTTHPHSRMNRHPDESSMQGDFDNAVLTMPTGEVHFTTDDQGTYHMHVYTRSGERKRLYEVTRAVGSRYMQAYIGRQLEGPEPPDHDIWKEHRLPFGYWFKLNSWVPRVYTNGYQDEELCEGLPVDEAIDGEPQVDVYAANCMNCHNTFPYAYRIFHDYMVGFPDATVSAELHGLSQAVSTQLDIQPDVESFLDANEQLDPDKHLVTLGVSCESCHFGGREHAEREREIKFLPTSNLTRISADDPRHLPTGERHNAFTTRGICTQCHSGKSPLFPNGAGKNNSREGLDLFAGSCATELSCIDCHEPHTGTPAELTGVVQQKHLDACASCHTQYQDQQFALAHSGPGHGEVNCLDCHMPKYTRGINNLIHSHRISMPVEESMVAAGMANACNSCHLDKSVRWALNQQKRIWGSAPEPNDSWDTFYSLDVPAGEWWLASDDSHMRFLATQWLALSRFARNEFAAVAASLNDPVPVNRVYAASAIRRILGLETDADIQVNIVAAPAKRQQQIDALVERYTELLRDMDN